MLLQALKALSESEERLPSFYSLQRVGYRIDLDRSGRVVSFVEIGRDTAPLAIPYRTRTSKPLALPVDRGDYVLGVSVAGKAPKEAAKRHELWTSLIGELLEITSLKQLKVVHRFALGVDPAKLGVPEGFDPSRFVAIYVDGSFFADDERVQQWWAQRQMAELGTGQAPTQCSVCGEHVPVVENVTTQVRGLSAVGGKATMALISGNMDVFERHGLSRASGASICTSCGEATHQALNKLLGDPARSKTLGTSKFLWWTSVPVADFIGALISGDTDESVAQIFEAVLTGKVLPSLSADRFYAVILSANVNRVVVRSWLDISLPEALANARSWLDRISVVDHAGDLVRHPGVWSLVASLAAPGQGSPLSRVSPSLIDDVLRSALTGARLPYRVLAQCVQRIRAEQGSVTTPRAALLKAFFSQHLKESPMAQLDTAAIDPAYQCGRLLALFDQAARLATSANNSLVDRNYASASTMPALTFPRLVKLHRAHIDKLRRDKPGAAYRIEGEVEDVMKTLTGFPKIFGPTEQGQFALGLYQQMASARAAAQVARIAKSGAADNGGSQDAAEEGE
jgi:CRISPR-associated protein Csd1